MLPPALPAAPVPGTGAAAAAAYSSRLPSCCRLCSSLRQVGVVGGTHVMQAQCPGPPGKLHRPTTRLAATHLASAALAAARCACTAAAARCTAPASRCTRGCRCCPGCCCQAAGLPAELLHCGATLRRAKAAAASCGLAAMPQQGPKAHGRCGRTFTIGVGACRRAGRGWGDCERANRAMHQWVSAQGSPRSQQAASSSCWLLSLAGDACPILAYFSSSATCTMMSCTCTAAAAVAGPARQQRPARAARRSPLATQRPQRQLPRHLTRAEGEGSGEQAAQQVRRHGRQALAATLPRPALVGCIVAFCRMPAALPSPTTSTQPICRPCHHRRHSSSSRSSGKRRSRFGCGASVSGRRSRRPAAAATSPLASTCSSHPSLPSQR